MKPQSAKKKGRDLQKHVASKIRETFNLPEEDVVSRPMGSGGTDIMMSKAAHSKLALSLECKNSKKFPSVSALEQARYNSRPVDTPAACWKPPGKGYDETIIYFNLNEFLEWQSRK